jgi:hypothetical protein|tara:strand:- start:984 stop:1238 length:255 start_codon:yes stop_codon:yes gene_type:complete
MKKFIHINQLKIRSNKKHNTNEPVITCKTYKSNDYAHNLEIKDKDDVTVAKIVYSPEKPLSCGAKVWIETNEKIVLDNGLCLDK